MTHRARFLWSFLTLTTALSAACDDGGGAGDQSAGGSAGGSQATSDAAAGGQAAVGGQVTGGVQVDAAPVPDAARAEPDGPASVDAFVSLPDAAPPGPEPCEGSNLPRQPFLVPDEAAGHPPTDFGPLRHQYARDFSTVLADGTPFKFSEHWTGCESYVFLTDSIPLADADATAAWSQDIAALLAGSPRNVNYVFISRSLADETARQNVETVGAQVEAAVADLPEDEAEHWRKHVLLVGEAANSITGWMKSALRGHGVRGFAVDRFQRVRGVGSMADVTRYSEAAAAAMQWPWTNNIAYAAHEARRFNFEADRAARMVAETVTTVHLFQGETVAGFQDVEADLPSAEVMDTFDTLEVEVEQRCPNGEAAEAGNCGAWDYLAFLWLADDMDNRTELARFITTYHREAHWVIDATPMLALLKAGGHRKFRWEFAPEWNTQPTATWLSLRFSNRGKGYRPDTLVSLGAGGGFNALYNATRLPIDVEIPADAVRTEVYAVITGHGAETNQCAEFCNHQHKFTVNGNRHFKEFPEAQVADGCVNQIERGMTPNQYGTWWFGRGGWCPGQQVDPYVVDVTDETPAGATATVAYEGLYRDRTPPDGAGNIVLSAYLVIYR